MNEEYRESDGLGPKRDPAIDADSTTESETECETGLAEEPYSSRQQTGSHVGATGHAHHPTPEPAMLQGSNPDRESLLSSDPSVGRDPGVLSKQNQNQNPNSGTGSDPDSDPNSDPDPDPDPSSNSDLAEAEREAAAPAVAAWVGFVFVCGGVAVVPWTVYLALTLPLSTESGHYRLAWVGFDLLLAFTLLHVGWIAAGGPTRNDRVELPATAAGTLLLVDAWFDTTTAADTAALLEALLFALIAELPMAAICFWIAHHAEAIRQRRLRLLPRLERLVRR